MLVNFIPYITTTNSVTFVIEDQPTVVTSTHKNYEKILEVLTSKEPKNEEDLMALANPIVAVERLFGGSDTDNLFLDVDDIVKAKLEGYTVELPDVLAAEVIRIHEQVGNLAPLYNFIVKLYANPIPDVRVQLYGFIREGGLALKDNGNFLAYKNITQDDKDIYTKTFDNSPGSVVKMPRHQVVLDPNKTCAAGLHVASWSYLKHYSPSAKSVIVEINPENVISVPTDYKNAKMRVCEYKVLREVEQPQELKERAIWEEEQLAHDTLDEMDAYDELDGYSTEI